MAKQGQKFNKYSAEFKLEVLNKYFSGQGSAKSLAIDYGISHKTIETWISMYKQGKDVFIDTNNAKRGRPKEKTIDYKERYEILKKFQAFIEAQREKK